MVELCTVNARVTGSNPVSPSKNFNMEYNIKFDKTSNGIIIRSIETNKLIHMIAVPPSYGCYLFGLDKIACKFEGLMVVIKEKAKILYLNGNIIDIKLNLSKV